MKIIFNSDVLYNWALARPPPPVPAWLCRFCQQAAAHGSEIVIPETVRMELERIYLNDAAEILSKLSDAQQLFHMWGLSCDDLDVVHLDQNRDFLQELRECGASVTLEEPTIEDFREAHRRACLRLSPYPQVARSGGEGSRESKSDEMRDLIIWVLALRIANQEGAAMLVSKDHIHTDSFGDEEANSVNLFRQTGSDGVLRFLGIETHSEVVLKELFRPVWSILRDSGIPIGDDVAPHRIKPRSFLEDRNGLSQIDGELTVQLGAGHHLRCKIHLKLSAGILRTLRVSDIQSGAAKYDDITVHPDLALSQEQGTFSERYNALQSVLQI